MSEQRITDLRELTEILSDGWNRGLNYFRGQASDWPLIPSLGRLRSNSSHSDVEARLLLEFKKEYTRQHEDFSEKYAGPGAEKFNWDWVYLTIAQHHGLPTRLLDWTVNAKKALYFAVVDSDDHARSGDGVLFAFHDKTAVSPKSGVPCVVTQEAPFKLQNVRPFILWNVPIEVPKRITAQEGVLTWQPDHTKDLISILERGGDSRQRWQKWIVPREAKSHLRQQLESEGITTATMFPDLDGLCRHLKQKILG